MYRIPRSRHRCPLERASREGRDPRRLGIVVSAVNGGSLVELTGELDLCSADRLGTRLQGLGRQGELVRLDLAGLEFMDVAGLHVVLDAYFAARLGGWELRVRAPGRAVSRLCELTHTKHLLT